MPIWDYHPLEIFKPKKENVQLQLHNSPNLPAQAKRCPGIKTEGYKGMLNRIVRYMQTSMWT